MAKEERKRVWFLTINKNAGCYEQLEEILENLECEGHTTYAWIVHDKDIDENGELKPEHKHAYIVFDNAHTMTSMMKKFNGAHIEAPRDETRAYFYLMHDTEDSRKKGKHLYPREEVHFSRGFVEPKRKSNNKEAFDEDKIPGYIQRNILSALQFVQTFGIDAFNKYWRAYSTIVLDYKKYDEATRGLVNDYVDEELPF